MFEKTDLIFAYTRRQAIEDGVLVDVTDAAKEAGFSVPVALTCAAWAEYVTVPDGVSGQDEKGRLWDVLSMLRFHIGLWGADVSEVRFSLYVLNRAGDEPELGELKAVCGPDDDGMPCVTIMLTHED